MRRKRSEETPSGVGKWLVTYSDMITLCLTFFVLLYSFSTLDAIKWKTVLKSVQGALGPISSGTKPLEGETFDNGAISNEEAANEEIEKLEIEHFKKYQQETARLEEIRLQLADYFASQGLSDSITIHLEERGLVLRFEDSVLFEKGKADLIEHSNAVLQRTGEILQSIDNPIRIEGHTDDLPINTLRFPSNWELSMGRSATVLRHFLKQGLDPKRLVPAGYGEYHPIAPNDSENNRKKNRRVDIVIIRGDMKYYEPE